MLISDLVPLAMDGLSVALACNACSPWNSGAWDSRFEVRDQKKIRDLRFEVSKETTVGTLEPITKKTPQLFTPVFITPPLPTCSLDSAPFLPFSSCGNRARAAPISYRQSLLQISKRSDCCIRHPQHSIQCQRQSRHRFIFCHSRLTARFGSLVQGRCTP